MSQDNKKSMVMYQGDGTNNVFSVPFDKGFYGEISVLFVRRGATTFEYDPKTFTLNEDNTLLTWTGDTLNLGDYICIIRNTETGQPYVYQNNQKHIEQALDNLSRQIQEALRMGENALKVDPTYTIDSSKMNPVDWLQTIIRCKDLSVRGLRFANNVLQYSKDDPEKPESEKTWYSLLNTDGITNVRERYDVGTVEYSTDGGANWKDVGETIRHNVLQGRDEADCHPISAITGLQDKLDEKATGSDTYTKTEVDEKLNLKADKTTTLQGYGITDAYTKAEVDAKVSSVYRFRGSVATYADLPTTGQVVGDVWNVEDTGANYAWSGSEWVKISETVDLTPYLTKTDAADTYATKTELNTKLSTVATDGKTITGNGTTADPLTVAKSGTGLDIGDIIYTTRTDNELAGKVECNGAQYNFADVNGGDNNVQALLESGALPSVTIAKFDAMVAEQGGCDSFGYGTDTQWTRWEDGTPDYVYTTKASTATEVGDPVYDAPGGNIIGHITGVDTEDRTSISYKETDGTSRVGYFYGAVDGPVEPVTYFKVPKKLGRVLVRSQKPTADNNYTWFNVYSDGWVEQGGKKEGILNNTDYVVTFPVEMAELNYTYTLGQSLNAADIYDERHAVANFSTKTTTGISIKNTRFAGGTGHSMEICWQVSGYAAASEYTKDKWDYQNVQVERPMVQLFNGATDEALATCTEVLADVAGLKQTTDGMIDYVVESQEPTSTNGYTWYRLYKSGWCEQGGIGICSGSATMTNVSLPIAMQDSNYTYLMGVKSDVISPSAKTVWLYNATNTSFQVNTTYSNAGVSNYASLQFAWSVSGMSAQGGN